MHADLTDRRWILQHTATDGGAKQGTALAVSSSAGLEGPRIGNAYCLGGAAREAVLDRS
jgi:hypothetical protein